MGNHLVQTNIGAESINLEGYLRQMVIRRKHPIASVFSTLTLCKKYARKLLGHHLTPNIFSRIFVTRVFAQNM